MATEKPVSKVILTSSDNESFEVDRDVIKLSTTIDTMLQGLLYFGLVLHTILEYLVTVGCYF